MDVGRLKGSPARPVMGLIAIIFLFTGCRTVNNFQYKIFQQPEVISIDSVPVGTFNAKIFIEPHVAVSFDSTLFKVESVFSNTYYNTESVSFKYSDSTGKDALIFVNSDLWDRAPLSQEAIDSLIVIAIHSILLKQSDSMAIEEDVALYYMGFSGLGVIAKTLKGKKEYSVGQILSKYYEGGRCTIEYGSSGTGKVTDFETDNLIIGTLINGIQIFSINEIKPEEDRLKRQISITIDSIGRPEDDHSYMPFYRRVNVSGCSPDIILEIRLKTEYGSQIFHPNPDGSFIISGYDKKAGVIERTGEVIVVNSFGKEVAIPFRFSYYSIGK